MGRDMVRGAIWSGAVHHSNTAGWAKQIERSKKQQFALSLLLLLLLLAAGA